MQFHFENQGNCTYLTYDIFQTAQLDFSAKEMITNNNIPGLATATFMQIDEKYCIRYEVSSMISASQLFAGTVNKKRMLGFFRGIADAFTSIEEYMLDEKMLVLDFDYIFINVSTAKTVMLCLPIQNVEMLQKQQDIMSFLKGILYNTKFDTSDDNSYIALLMNYFNSNSTFVSESFKALLDEIEEIKNKVTDSSATISTSIASVPKIQTQYPSVSSPPVFEQILPNPRVSEVAVSKPPSVSEIPVPSNTPMKLPDGSSMMIPNANNPLLGSLSPRPNTSGNNSAEQNTNSEDTEEISWLYLMQHYNKENAAKYKAQKEAKKKKKKGNTTMLISNAKSSLTENQPLISSSVSAQQTNPAQTVPTQQAFSQVYQPVMQPSNFAPDPRLQPAPTMPFTNPIPGTTVLNPNTNTIPGTTVLNPNIPTKKKAYLYRVKTRERIEITNEIFRIGRDGTYVDYCISDNTAISSSHAYIILKNNHYYIIDTNSTNHTYINNMTIPSNVETEITNNNRICFADEEFEFKII